MDLGITKPKAEEIKLKILIYGKNGMGKTELGASSNNVPDMKNTLIIAAEEAGTQFLGNRPDRIPDPPDIYKLDLSIGRANLIYGYLLKEKDHGYNTVVVDSLTDLFRVWMDDIMTKGVSKGRREDLTDVQWKDWGAVSSEIARWCRKLIALPMHVIFISHSNEKLNEKQEELITPSMNQALMLPICNMVNIIGYMNMEKGAKPDEIERNIYFQPTKKYLAKDHSDRLGFGLKNPTMQKIYEKIKG